MRQMKFMHAKEPEVAAKWDAKYGKAKNKRKQVSDLPPPPKAKK